MIWKYESKGVYSSKSLYAITKFKGVKPIYLPVVWSLKIPHRIQVFLWLFSQNKIMTRDNLRKRGIAKPLECTHYTEIESIHHLFFECQLAMLLLKYVLIFLIFMFMILNRWRLASYVILVYYILM